MKVKTRIDYYKITLPSDLIQSPHEWLEQMSAIAIDQAKESARLYCVPCTWDCHLVSGGPDAWESTFKVRRRRLRGDK